MTAQASPIHVQAALRLPQGRFNGALKSQSATALGITLVQELIARHPSHCPSKIWWGMARPHTQGMNPARTIAIQAKLPISVLGASINMACGSGLQAVFSAVYEIAQGAHQCLIAGGSESMSNTPFLLPDYRWGFKVGHMELPDAMHLDGLKCPITGLLMGQTIEHLAAKHRIGRSDADQYALESHRRASLADFAEEIVPTLHLEKDECIRHGATLGELAQLQPVYSPQGQVTAGNASAISDGAAAVLLAAPQASYKPPIAKILGWSEVALDPIDMGFGPVPAIQALVEQHKLSIPSIRHWEINEAFAAQVLACARALKLPGERLNPCGGGISLGHPIAASGARILVTLIHQLRAKGGGLGIAALGVGGGIGQAVLVEC